MTRRIKNAVKRRSPAVYTDEQIEFCRERYNKLTVRELVDLFNKTYPDNQITNWQLYRMNYKNNFKGKRKVGCRNSPIWTKEMVEFCRNHSKEYSYREMAEVLSKKFDTKIIEEQISSMYARYGITNGKPTAFTKGHVPHNKGKKWTEYLTDEQIEIQRRTCYKKGNIPYTWKPVGTITLRKDTHGSNRKYNYIKFQDKKGSYNFMPYSHYVYEHAHKVKLKSNDVIIHLDGNSLNDSVENLYLINNTESATLNKCYRNITNPELKLASILTVRTRNKVKELKNDSTTKRTK